MQLYGSETLKVGSHTDCDIRRIICLVCQVRNQKVMWLYVRLCYFMGDFMVSLVGIDFMVVKI